MTDKTMPPPLIEKYGSDLVAPNLLLESPDHRSVSSGCQRYVTTDHWLPLIAEGWLVSKKGSRNDSRALHKAVIEDAIYSTASATVSSSSLHASHLIADRFGGLDIYPNLLPFAQEVNQGHWTQFENNLARMMQQERTYLKAFVTRQPDSTYPDRVIYHVFQQRSSDLRLVCKEFIGFTGFLH
jgi:hypothetical protein